MPPPTPSLWDYFSDLPDPRRSQGRRHKLRDILAVALCAVLCGADDFTEIEAFGETREAWLRQFLELPHCIPSHDTFGRVFAALDPTSLRALLHVVGARGGRVERGCHRLNRRQDGAPLLRRGAGLPGHQVGKRLGAGAAADLGAGE